MPDRIQRICLNNAISEKEAKILIEQTDKKRASYYNYFSNKTWGLSTSYDVCINSSVFGIENIVSLIEFYVKRRFLI
jgi:cytidylate kinase